MAKQSPPPVYLDMGKSCRDLFSKGFHFGLVKLDLKTKSSSGVDLTGAIVQNTDKGLTNGNVEVKLKLPEYNAELVEKWNTDNVILMEGSVSDKLGKGSKVALVSTFAPFSGKWSAVNKNTFKHDMATMNVDVDFFNGPQVMAAMTLGYQGFLAGYQTSYDMCKGRMTKSNFAAGYQGNDIQMHAFCDDGSEFGGTIYHKVRKDLEAGMQVGFTMGPNTTRLAVSTKYVVDRNTSFRLKLNNSAQLGLSMSSRLRDGITAVVSSMLDMRSLNQGGHKLGVCLELEA